jgi:hypothetical protein
MAAGAIRARRGFVTLDLMWIVVLLALAVVLSIKGVGLADERENADRLKRELVAITMAVEKLAEEEGLEPGARVPFSLYSRFVEKGAPKRLREEGEDPLGGSYGDQVVGEPAVPDAGTVEKLGEAWEPGS